MIPEDNQPIDLSKDLVDMSRYRIKERSQQTRDPILIYLAYAQDSTIYNANGTIVECNPKQYHTIKTSNDLEIRNQLVNKFGHVYAKNTPLLLHKKLADIVITSAIDLYTRYGFITVIMDGLRTYDSGVRMQENRADLVASGMLAKAGYSAHNRALAVDSKLFKPITANTKKAPNHDWQLHELQEADEHGHLDDEQDMSINSRYYKGPMSDEARHNRLERLRAWQRASVAHKTPLANLLSEFWDDRLTGSPADMWRVLVCRGLCIEHTMHPKDNPDIAALKQKLDLLHQQQKSGSITRDQMAHTAHTTFCDAWNTIFSDNQRQQLDQLLGPDAGNPPTLSDFVFHEWLETIHDKDLQKVNINPQST